VRNFTAHFHFHPVLVALAVLYCIPLLACKMPNDTLPRNQNLPLFNPHMQTFSCEVEANKVPAIDAQAEAWFLEARALEDPEILVDDREHQKIVQLTRQAAERRHWKAMLDLASMYLEGRDPKKGVDDAVRLVEEAMRLGIPAAYDRMGTFYMNGTGVEADATRAYAFWQKAAQMGNPQAMTYLGDKLDANRDSGNGTFWANKPVARQMLECAFGQGYGPAAYQLAFAIAGNRPPSGSTNRTREDSTRAIWVLHQGVKFGCADCAGKLSIEFDRPWNLADMLAPHIDKARGERYKVLNKALGFDPNRRFPNLDQVLPLPPAPLPSWNGERDTLLEAAMGVKVKPPPPKPTAASERKGRHFLDAAFHFRHANDKTSAEHAPKLGYWQPSGHRQVQRVRAQLEKVPPGLYRADEPFERFFDTDGSPVIGLLWERWDTQWHNNEAVEPRAASGLIREIDGNALLMSFPAGRICPARGVWQPWVAPSHSLSTIVNQHWRQVWLNKGDPFPRSEQEWLLALPEQDVTWYLMDDTGANLV
jgi:hypothetical protein